MWCMNVVHGSVSALVVWYCYMFKCGVLCLCVFSYRLCLYMCVETVDNSCGIADTLLNGVRARLWSLHGCLCAIDKRIVDMTRAGDDTVCTHRL